MIGKLRIIVFFAFVVLFSGFASADIIFSDGFESGSLNGWELITIQGASPWNVSTINAPYGNWTVRAEPLNNSLEPASVLQTNISTLGYDNITFSYYRRLVGLDISDEFKVKWFDGLQWNVVEETMNSSVTNTSWIFKSFNLPASAGNSNYFKIRFECTANTVGEDCRVDDVNVEGELISVGMQNYYGNFNYMSGYDYYVYVNQSNSEISFRGLNVSNQFETHTSVFDSLNRFVKRINYVWFSGWFDLSNLFMNQYVGAGVIYSGSASQIFPGSYEASLNMNNIPYLNLSTLVNVTLDMNNMKSTFDPVSFPGQISVADISQDWQTAGHVYGPVLFETKLVNNTNSSNIQVNLWVKEDLAVNGMNTTWVNSIFVV